MFSDFGEREREDRTRSLRFPSFLLFQPNDSSPTISRTIPVSGIPFSLRSPLARVFLTPLSWSFLLVFLFLFFFFLIFLCNLNNVYASARGFREFRLIIWCLDLWITIAWFRLRALLRLKPVYDLEFREHVKIFNPLFITSFFHSYSAFPNSYWSGCFRVLIEYSAYRFVFKISNCIAKWIECNLNNFLLVLWLVSCSVNCHLVVVVTCVLLFVSFRSKRFDLLTDILSLFFLP